MFTINYTLCLFQVDDGHEEDVEVPKALGDVFESLAGAVYLVNMIVGTPCTHQQLLQDCGMKLDVVWRVYFNLMKDVIQNCCANPPLSPIRELFELKGTNAHFTYADLFAVNTQIYSLQKA